MSNNSAPLASIVTPCLNAASTLELTLESVAAQTYPNIEHVVVDGGSTDGTIEILRNFRSSVPLRWISGSDTGMYAAINKGIELAQGDVLSYLNSDDLYFPWSVETAVGSLLSGSRDLVFGDLVVLVKRGQDPSARIQFYPRFRPRVYAHQINMGQPTVFWSRRVTDSLGGFDESLRYCGDFEYWLRTAAAGFRYEHVREVLAVAVEHDRALTAMYYPELRREFEAIKERYSDALKPPRFPRLRAAANVVDWRREVLALRLNLRKPRPSSWINHIEFLRRTGLDEDRVSLLRLFLPWSLPKSRPSPWRLDPVEFEKQLAREIQSRRTAV